MSTKSYPDYQYHPETISSFLSPFPADREQIYVSLANDYIGKVLKEKFLTLSLVFAIPKIL
jgi:hypothetical protein